MAHRTKIALVLTYWARLFMCPGKYTSTLPLHWGREASDCTSCALLTLCYSVIFRRNSVSPVVVPPSNVPFLLFFRLLTNSMLKYYIATSWFVACFTLPDSLHMWLHMDELILQCNWCVQGFFFLLGLDFVKKKQQTLTRVVKALDSKFFGKWGIRVKIVQDQTALHNDFVIWPPFCVRGKGGDAINCAAFLFKRWGSTFQDTLTLLHFLEDILVHVHHLNKLVHSMHNTAQKRLSVHSH